jgi:hypothetical protein
MKKNKAKKNNLFAFSHVVVFFQAAFDFRLMTNPYQNIIHMQKPNITNKKNIHETFPGKENC